MIHLSGSPKGPFKVIFKSLDIFLCGGCDWVLSHHTKLCIYGEHRLASIPEKKWFKTSSSGPGTVVGIYKHSELFRPLKLANWV